MSDIIQWAMFAMRPRPQDAELGRLREENERLVGLVREHRGCPACRAAVAALEASEESECPCGKALLANGQCPDVMHIDAGFPHLRAEVVADIVEALIEHGKRWHYTQATTLADFITTRFGQGDRHG